jgi:hypothetical protein
MKEKSWPSTTVLYVKVRLNVILVRGRAKTAKARVKAALAPFNPVYDELATESEHHNIEHEKYESYLWAKAEGRA